MTIAADLVIARAMGWRYQPSALPSTCVNDTVVCLATGPSLSQIDVDYVRHKASVIVVNDAHRLAPWATALYSSDRYWWKHYKGVPSFKGIKVGIEHSPGRHDDYLPKSGVLVMALTGHQGVERKRTGLRSCAANSGGAAVNLAAHLHPKRIVLLGYDMGATQGRRHFFGDHPRGLSNSHNFPTWRKAFDTMAPTFAELGIKVINCSRITSLSAFPVRRLEDTL